MPKKIALVVTALLIAASGNAQHLTLVDSILNNQVNLLTVKDDLDASDLWTDSDINNSLNNNLFPWCEADSEIIVQIGDSLYVYNFDTESLSFITKEIHGIASSFGYLKSNQPKIVSSAYWDSIYYFIESNWTYSDYTANSSFDLIHIACGVQSTYLMGSNLWYFNGSNSLSLIRSNINYSVADLVVDEKEYAWVITRTTWPIADTLRIIDSLGTSICDIPFAEPINTLNGYGMVIRNGKVMVGFGPNNPNYPNSIVPLEINSEDNVVSFGDPILMNSEFILDLAGCSKGINQPNCTITSLEEFGDKPEIEIFPNPFQNKLSVKGEKVTSIKVLDILGKVCLHIKNDQPVIEIDTTSYPKGIYLISIEFDSKIVQNKLIIKN
ncbi:MAG: T9SS type A sorting domain-containing protein [Bacteroidota bacterium]